MRAVAPLAVLLCALGAATSAPPARRIVSLNPSLTAIAVALGAGDALVGVDDFSARQQPAVADRPTVGGLYDPSLESLVALKPDLVVLVQGAQQRDFAERVEQLGIRVESFENTRFAQVLDNVTRLGELTGHREAAERRVAAIRAARDEVRAAAAGRPQPATVLVLQREPLFVVGRGSFLDEMLASAGARNLGAHFDQPYPRASLEWLLGAAPALILDASPGDDPPLRYWSRWPSLPAVRSGDVARVDPRQVTLPGPYLDRALRTLAALVEQAR